MKDTHDVPLSTDLGGLVDRMSEWQYHVDIHKARNRAGGLVEHANRHNAAASSWPTVAGPDIP